MFYNLYVLILANPFLKRITFYDFLFIYILDLSPKFLRNYATQRKMNSKMFFFHLFSFASNMLVLHAFCIVFAPLVIFYVKNSFSIKNHRTIFIGL